MKEKEFTHMTYNDRLRLDALIRAKHKPKEIAEILHKHISTIYRELGRGRYMHTNSDLTENIHKYLLFYSFIIYLLL